MYIDEDDFDFFGPQDHQLDRPLGLTADCFFAAGVAAIMGSGDISKKEQDHMATCDFCKELVERSVRLNQRL